MYSFQSKRGSVEEITEKLKQEREKKKIQKRVIEQVLTAANEYTRKNFDRNFIKAVEEKLTDDVRLTMPDAFWPGYGPKGYQLCLYGGPVMPYDNRMTFYNVKTIEEVREEAKKYIAGIENSILDLSHDIESIKFILTAYDRMHAAAVDLDALQKAAWAYREHLPMCQ